MQGPIVAYSPVGWADRRGGFGDHRLRASQGSLCDQGFEGPESVHLFFIGSSVY